MGQQRCVRLVYREQGARHVVCAGCAILLRAGRLHALARASNALMHIIAPQLGLIWHHRSTTSPYFFQGGRPFAWEACFENPGLR